MVSTLLGMSYVRKHWLHILKYVAATIVIFVSGWMMLGYYGLKTTAEGRARGWDIYQLPSHPEMFMAAYLAVGLALPFLSAWLLRPLQIGERERTGLWHRYAFRLLLSFVGATLAAFMLAFLEMALMDAGVI